jgi:hypothetical protein
MVLVHSRFVEWTFSPFYKGIVFLLEAAAWLFLKVSW